MSSVTQLCRVSARLAARTSRRKASLRGFSGSAAPCAAQNFNLPSLSPTMTEGGISSWKVKEGDSFSVGDVLLEIETDKAQMDVEAQEDGKVFKIIEQDGAKGIKVGARIAVLAEADDDLASLEMPAEESNPGPESKGEASLSEKETPLIEKEKTTEKKTSSSPPKEEDKSPEASSPASANDNEQSQTKSSSRKYPLYPSVQALLHISGISSSDILKIPASGPNGRLLKGDVLSYLGKIEKSYSSAQSKRIEKMGHLDLSKIKKAAPKVDANASKATKKAAAAAPEVEPDTQIAVPISLTAVFATQRRLQDSLGIMLPLSTFIARASEIANEELPRAHTATTADELFDSILGLDKVKPRKTTSTGRYVPQITALPSARAPASSAQRIAMHRHSATAKAGRTIDVLDSLIGGSAKAATRRSQPAAAGTSSIGGVASDNVFSLMVKKGEEKRARVYLERVKTVLEADPGSCVL